MAETRICQVSDPHAWIIDISTHTEVLAGLANSNGAVTYQIQDKLSSIGSLADQHANEGNPVGTKRGT